VKTIRICHPQEPNTSRPKSDFFVSNKVEKQCHTICLCCYLTNSNDEYENFSPTLLVPLNQAPCSCGVWHIRYSWQSCE